MQKKAKNVLSSQFCPLCHRQNPHLFFEKFEKSYGKKVWRRYWQCSTCQLVYLSKENHWSQEKERERYEEHDNDLSHSGYKRSLERLWFPVKEALLQSHFDVNLQSLSVDGLDFGCGPLPKNKTSSKPALIELLSLAGVHVEGYDPFFAPNQKLLTRQYDFILLNEVIEHVVEPYCVFQRFQKMLRKGGVLGVQTQVLDSSVDFEHWGYRQDPTHICFYTPKTLDFIGEKFSWMEIFRKGSVILWRA